MGLLNLKLFSNNTKDEKNFISMAITSDGILTSVWEIEAETPKILGHAHKKFHNIDALIHEAAAAIDEAAKNAQSDVSKVVFGLSNYWLEDGRLTKESAEILKNLSEDLDLDPQAFVSLASSINHYLKIKDAQTPNCVAIGLFSDFTEVSLLNQNKVQVSKTFKGKADEEKLEELLKGLKDTPEKKLPSQIYFYGSEESSHFVKHLESKKDDGIFESNLKAEHITDNDLVKTIVFSQAADILGHDPLYGPSAAVIAAESKDENQEIEDTASKPVDTTETKEEKKNENADEFGFVEGEDIAKTKVVEKTPEPAEAKKTEEYAVEVSKDEEVSHGYESPEQRIEETEKRHKKSIIDSILSLAYLDKVLGLLSSKKSSKKILAVLVFLLIFAAGIVFLISQTLVSARVIIKANSTPYDDNFSVNVASGATLDTSRSRIPGDEVSAIASGSQQTPATGKKKTGTNAKGEVKVLNWTTAETTFDKGTVIISKNGVKFQLDSQVKVASRSAALPGESNVGATAQDFGTNANISSGSEFTFQKFDELLYSAKANNDFTGGDEKEVTVIAKDDIDKLEKSLTQELTEKAKNDLSQKLEGQNISDDAIEIVVKSKQFDKKVDEEASQLTLNLDIEAKALIYKEETLKDLLAQMATNQNSDGLEARPENIEISDVILKRNKGSLTISGKYQASLVSKIDEEKLKEEIAGKSQKDARKLITDTQKAADVQFIFTPNLLIFPNLPKNPQKISFEIDALK